MLIDWFTVGAQIFNFLLLLVLLRYFLYGPITKAMDSREDRIAGQFHEAEENLAEAEGKLAEMNRREQGFEEEQERKARAVAEEAEARRRKLLKQAKEEAEEIRQAWREGLAREKERFFSELKRRTGGEVMRISRRAVSDLADDDFERRLAEVFVGRLEALEGAERERLASAARGESAAIDTPVEFSADLRGRTAAALSRFAGEEVPVKYFVDPERHPEVALKIGGMHFSWGVESYFDSMEEYLCEILDLSDGECREGTTKA
jgi:F-type H+-transporting ATPase subunit b